MEDALWFVIGPYIPALAGLLVALCVVLAVLFALVDGVRVDSFRVFSKTALARLTKDPYQ